MTRKIFRSILLVAGVVLAAGMVIMTGCLYSYFGGVQEQQLQDELSLAVSGVENGGTAYLERLPAERFRLTWIASDGRVLYDTQVVDVASMENHAGRQEVQEALKNGSGESSRYSDTLLQQTLYVARRLTDGTVLRISVSRATAGMLALGMLQPMLVVLAAALIFAGLMAGRLSRRIVDPLNRLDLEHPLENDAYEELAPLDVYKRQTLGIVQVGTLGLLALVSSFVFEAPHLPQSGTQWLMIAGLAVICTGFGFTLQPVAQSHTTAQRAGLFCALSPACATLLGAAVLREHISVMGMCGIALILLSLLVPQLSQLAEKKGITLLPRHAVPAVRRA